MRIAVIGAGAMGSIYGGRLSQKHEVYLVDTNEAVVEAVNRNGLVLVEGEKELLCRPKAVTSTEGIGEMDLVILFVKSLFSRAALSGNLGLIGEDTYLLTLQNGSGHEELLQEYVGRERVIIGTTEDNGAVLDYGRIRHGGTGRTNIGMLCEDRDGFLPRLKEGFDACGFEVLIHENIQQLIWDKLFTNVSLSAVTGLLKCEIGYIGSNPHAWALTEGLLHEAVEVAHGLGLSANEEELKEKIRKIPEHSPAGITSICADLRAGRRTEVETISGSVVRAAEKCGKEVPLHRFAVEMIHAMEGLAGA